MLKFRLPFLQEDYQRELFEQLSQYGTIIESDLSTVIQITSFFIYIIVQSLRRFSVVQKAQDFLLIVRYSAESQAENAYQAVNNTVFHGKVSTLFFLLLLGWSV